MTTPVERIDGLTQHQRNVLAARVLKGAAFLDRRCPGWERKVRQGELDMANACRCVLGQIARALSGDTGGDYWTVTQGRARCRGFAPALESIAMSDSDTVRRGFNLGNTGPLSNEAVVWPLLNQMWLDQIRVRTRAASYQPKTPEFQQPRKPVRAAGKVTGTAR